MHVIQNIRECDLDDISWWSQHVIYTACYYMWFNHSLSSRLLLSQYTLPFHWLCYCCLFVCHKSDNTHPKITSNMQFFCICLPSGKDADTNTLPGFKFYILGFGITWSFKLNLLKNIKSEVKDSFQSNLEFNNSS